MDSFEKISTQVQFDAGFFSVVTSTFHESTTNTDFDRTYVDHIGAVAVIPVLDDGNIVLIEQYRGTIEQLSLEVVAGRRDVEGEPLETCALRELAEEVAYTADTISSLGWVHTTPGYSNEVIHLFMATDCRALDATEPDGVEEQLARSVVVSVDKALELVQQGAISDTKSIVAIYRLAHELGYSITQ